MGGTDSELRGSEHPAVKQRVPSRGQGGGAGPAHHLDERRLLGQDSWQQIDLAPLDRQPPPVGGKVRRDPAEIGDSATFMGDEVHEQALGDPADPDPTVGGKTLGHGLDVGERAGLRVDPGADQGCPVLIGAAVHQQLPTVCRDRELGAHTKIDSFILRSGARGDRDESGRGGQPRDQFGRTDGAEGGRLTVNMLDGHQSGFTAARR